jgi:GDPmannose 4,6-dehydratase
MYTADADAMGTLAVLSAARSVVPKARIYVACSSEMFGNALPPQSETTPFKPRSPYGSSKVFAYHEAVNHREAYGMFVSCGILFNHESERRGETFVTRKITRALGRIKYGLQDEIRLGNLDAVRDWGHAEDYVRAMWLMLQHDKPDDFVIGTGESRSVREFLALAQGFVMYEPAKIVQDDRYLRPTEVANLRANPTKAYRTLGWKPTIGFEDLVRRMVTHDLELARREALK